MWLARVDIVLEGMKMLVLAISILIVTSGCRDFSVTPDGESAANTRNQESTISTDNPFEMAPGDTVHLEGAGISVEFSFVYEESRCRKNVDCIHPGSASILMHVAKEGGGTQQIIVSIPGLVRTPYRTNHVIQYEGYRFRLLKLSPHPVNPEDVIPEQEYRAIMEVTPVYD